ncbi:DNA-directed RNA polymerase I subunit rpa49 [Ascosphaera pollenicola]|nr:DNA-directed RNA polymerase I subunit rpa49 [Ascosphaera pollenicola]
MTSLPSPQTPQEWYHCYNEFMNENCSIGYCDFLVAYDLSRGQKREGIMSFFKTMVDNLPEGTKKMVLAEDDLIGKWSVTVYWLRSEGVISDAMS